VTILSIVQDATVACGIVPVPTAAVSNTDPNIQKLVYYAKQGGRECLERANWVNLDIAGTVTGDGTSTLFQLPQDWIRFSPSDKSPRGALVSNKYPLRPLRGPVNTEDLNQLKAFPPQIIWPVWRIIGGALEIWPALSAGELVTFNYFGKFWISNAARTVSRPGWAADDDFSLIDEDLITKGAIWRWKASNGLQYAEEFRGYENSLARLTGQQMTERVTETSRKWVPTQEMFYGVITDLTTPITG
jgi:hypothetical protein